MIGIGSDGPSMVALDGVVVLMMLPLLGGFFFGFCHGG